MPKDNPEAYAEVDSPEAAAQMLVDYPPESAEEALDMLSKAGFDLTPATPGEPAEMMAEEIMGDEAPGAPMMDEEEAMDEMDEGEEFGGYRDKKDQRRHEPIGITIMSVSKKAMKKPKKKDKEEGDYE